MEPIDIKLYRRKAGIDATDVFGELGMLNVETGQYHMLNQVGSDIWRLIESPVTKEWIVDQLMSDYRVNRTECEEELKSFLDRLQMLRLVDVISENDQ